jgi:tetratricopeptide (TPR) repeat protein
MDPQQTIEIASRAAARAIALLAFEEGVRLYESALDLLDTAGVRDEAKRCGLLLGLGEAQFRSGEGVAAQDTFADAARVARLVGAPDILARAALGYGGRFVWARKGSDQRIVPLLTEALGALGDQDGALRVRLLSRLAGALRDDVDRAPCDALSQEALDLARSLGDPETLAYALSARWYAIFWPETPGERLALGTEMLSICERIGHQELAAAASFCRCSVALELGDPTLVKSELHSLERFVASLRQPAHRWLYLATQATHALFQGRFAEGEALTEQALALGHRAQPADAVLSHRIQVFTRRWQTGSLDGLDEILLLSLAEYPARPMFACMLAAFYSRLGRTTDARRLLDELCRDRFAILPRSNEWLFSLGFLAECASTLHDEDRSLAIYQALLPYADRHGLTPDYIDVGSMSRSLGALAITLGRLDDAERHLEHALWANERMGARPWVAHTRRELVRLSLATGGPRAAERATEAAEAATEEFRRLGMHPWIEETLGLI